MVVALQQVQNRIAEVRTELPGSTRPHRRSADTGGVPGSSAWIHRQSAGSRSARLRLLRHASGTPARVAGAGRVEVLSSDTREVEVIVDPTRPRVGTADGGRRVGRAGADESARAGGPLHRGRPVSTRARVGSVEGIDETATRRFRSRTAPRLRARRRVGGAAPGSHDADRERRTAGGGHQRVAADRRQHLLDVRRNVGGGDHRPCAHAACWPEADEDA